MPFYLYCGREMWGLTRKDISGESAAKGAAVLIAKWKARGLTEAVRQAIHRRVLRRRVYRSVRRPTAYS